MAKLQILANVPADVRLLSTEGEAAPSNYGPDEYKYRTDQGPLFVSDAVAKIFDAAIAQHGIKAGDPVRIVKAAGTFEHGRKGVRWSLTPAAGEASNGTLAVPRIAPQAAPVAQAANPNVNASSAISTWTEALVSQTNMLFDAYLLALDRAHAKHGASVKPDDIRALITTVYINATKNGVRHAA